MSETEHAERDEEVEHPEVDRAYERDEGGQDGGQGGEPDRGHGPSHPRRSNSSAILTATLCAPSGVK